MFLNVTMFVILEKIMIIFQNILIYIYKHPLDFRVRIILQYAIGKLNGRMGPQNRGSISQQVWHDKDLSC